MCAQSVTAGSGLSASCSMCAISSHGGLVRDAATYIQKKKWMQVRATCTCFLNGFIAFSTPHGGAGRLKFCHQ